MTRTFTPESLICHLYRETSLAQRIETHRALQEDFFLWEEYQVLRRAYRELPKVKLYPSGESIRKVLDYSAFQQQI